MQEDFIQKLSADEKIIFLRSLLHLVRSDAKVDDKERQFMHEVAAIYNFGNNLDVLKHKMSEEELLSEIKTTIVERRKALYLIKELLAVANIDEVLGDAEISFIEKTAQILNIEEEKILQINELILERKLWLYKQSSVMEEV